MKAIDVRSDASLDLVSVDDFADAISARWQDSVVAIIDVGKLLLGAKQALSHGEFGRMIAGERVPFGWRTAQRLMEIAGHSFLANTTHASHLPPSWMTVYELTKAPDDALEGWFSDGTVHPELQRKDVKRLLRALREGTPNEAADHDFLDGEDARLICGDALDEALKLPAGCADAIVTDPPYGAEFLECYDKLAVLADHLLRDGGNCLVMTGQAHLRRVLNALEDELNYQWNLTYLTPGASTQVFGRHVKSNCKSVVWLTKGANENEHISDLIVSDQEDKRFHHWGQSVGGMAEIIERFSRPKDLIVDPFCGGGTTGVAALGLGRRFVGIDSNASCMGPAGARLVGMRKMEEVGE